MGSLSLQPATSMWELVDGLVDEARADTPVVVVDVHAEATSEKVALARWLDGRVTAVIGTHTHVQTSDARVQPGGTAALTDAGMTGPHDSVIGVKAEQATHRMRTGMAVRFEVADGDIRIEGALVNATPPPAARARSGRFGFPGPETDVGGRDDERQENGEQHEVADEHEPRRGRVEVLHELPVVAREPEPGEAASNQHERGRHKPAAPPARARLPPAQTRNCGDNTLPSATNAMVAAAA